MAKPEKGTTSPNNFDPPNHFNQPTNQPESLKTPSEPHPNPNLTIPIFHNFPIFCLPVLRMLLIPSLHGTAVGSVRHSATASGLCFQLIEVLQDQLPTTLPWC